MFAHIELKKLFALGADYVQKMKKVACVRVNEWAGWLQSATLMNVPVCIASAFTEFGCTSLLRQIRK